MPEPFLLIAAGPNGSGKTTLTNFLRQKNIDFGEYINPDEIALQLSGTYGERVREAQSIADVRRDQCIESWRNFSLKTVMSHPSKIEIMRRAKEYGFNVCLFFVGTINPHINVDRVNQRVRRGGHDVPNDKIRARYVRTIKLPPEAVRVAHRSILFDNSKRDKNAKSAMLMVAEFENDADGLKIFFLKKNITDITWVKPHWPSLMADEYNR